MEEKRNQITLKEKWKNFLNIILDPWVILLLIATVVFIICSTKTTDNNILPILTLIISLMSGLLGGIIANRWAQMTELTVLVARGKSAIRSLKLILLNISNIEKRTKVYITNIDEKDEDYKLIKSNFEEVIEKCNILEEEIISSIENWTDIIPEVANLKTQIGVISEMKLKQTDLEDDISALVIKIEREKQEDSKEKEELQKKLKYKETELNTTKEKLNKAESKINTSVLSGLTPSTLHTASSYLIGSNFSNSGCSKCGKVYLPSGIHADKLCDDCRSSNGFFMTTGK